MFAKATDIIRQSDERASPTPSRQHPNFPNVGKGVMNERLAVCAKKMFFLAE